MRKSLPGLILMLLSGLIFSCAYTNNEDYYAIPEGGPEPVFSISTSLDDSSLVYVGDSLHVSFTLSLEHALLYYVRASLDYLVLYSLSPEYNPDTLQGALVLSDTFLIDGSLPLEGDTLLLFLDVFHSSNTGSLGDFVGVEYLQQRSEFSLILEGGDQ